MAMIPPHREVPALQPMPTHRLEELEPAERTQTPSERGYLDWYPVSYSLHPSELQEKLVKLFFARYMSVSGDQIEIAIGLDNNPLVNRKTDRQQQRNHLRNIWWTMRSKTFGENGFFDKLIKHTVEKYDFEVTIYNIAISERNFQQVPPNENENDRMTREANLERFRQALLDHVSRYNVSRRYALDEAQRDLSHAESAPVAGMTKAQLRAQKKLIDEAQRLVKHNKSHNATWPDAPIHVGTPYPPDYYRDFSTRAMQLFWQSKWSADVGTTMLWELRNVIDIPATLQHANFIYKTAFVVLCIEACQDYLAIPSEVFAKGDYDARFQLTKDRRGLYRHLGEASKVHWPNEPGLDLLQIPASSPNSAKRKASTLESSRTGFDFTKE
jgi:hypothetical protein